MNINDRIEGCILAGSIGDAYGSGYENIPKIDDSNVSYAFGKPKKQDIQWQITDDTQLTLATCEALITNTIVSPEIFSNKFLEYYQQRRLTGIGASTLKALRELEVGGHWSQVGRSGEYAAGNGAAMRIAPLAFFSNISKQTIKDICSITHKNDEAYIGALSVVIAIKSVLNGQWNGNQNLLEIIIEQIPDTRIKDRLIEINKIQYSHSLKEIGKLGNNGYVVNSVPLAIVAASRINEIGLEKMFLEIVEIGGDTDTNCSIAGQIAGTLIGKQNIPIALLENLVNLTEYNWIINIVKRFKKRVQHAK